MMKKKILIIEDDSVYSKLLTDILSEEYDVIAAVDGIQGIKSGKVQKPDLIIIDLFLPRMHGEDVIRKLRDDEFFRTIPIVAISGTFSRTVSGEKFEDINADAVFSKPLEITRFEECIHKLLFPAV